MSVVCTHAVCARKGMGAGGSRRPRKETWEALQAWPGARLSTMYASITQTKAELQEDSRKETHWVSVYQHVFHSIMENTTGVTGKMGFWGVELTGDTSVWSFLQVQLMCNLFMKWNRLLWFATRRGIEYGLYAVYNKNVSFYNIKIFDYNKILHTFTALITSSSQYWKKPATSD